MIVVNANVLFVPEIAKAPHRIVWQRLDEQTMVSGVKTIESKTLQIRNFTASKDNGIYTCAFYSMPDNTLIDETQIELNLPSSLTSSSASSHSSSYHHNRQKIHVHVTVNDRYTLDYGSSVKMTCTTHSSSSTQLDTSAYSLEWIRVNDAMPNNSLVVDNSLTLVNVTEDNLGEYVCLVSNKAGKKHIISI